MAGSSADKAVGNEFTDRAAAAARGAVQDQTGFL